MRKALRFHSTLVVSVFTFVACSSGEGIAIRDDALNGKRDSIANGLVTGASSAATTFVRVRKGASVDRGDLQGASLPPKDSVDTAGSTLALRDQGTPDGTYRGRALMPGQVLFGSVNEYLSPEFEPSFMLNYLFMQSDCNLVVYQRRQGRIGDAAAYWSSGTSGSTTDGSPAFCYLRMMEAGAGTAS